MGCGRAPISGCCRRRAYEPWLGAHHPRTRRLRVPLRAFLSRSGLRWRARSSPGAGHSARGAFHRGLFRRRAGRRRGSWRRRPPLRLLAGGAGGLPSPRRAPRGGRSDDRVRAHRQVVRLRPLGGAPGSAGGGEGRLVGLLAVRVRGLFRARLRDRAGGRVRPRIHAFALSDGSDGGARRPAQAAGRRPRRGEPAQGEAPARRARGRARRRPARWRHQGTGPDGGGGARRGSSHQGAVRAGRGAHRASPRRGAPARPPPLPLDRGRRRGPGRRRDAGPALRDRRRRARRGGEKGRGRREVAARGIAPRARQLRGGSAAGEEGVSMAQGYAERAGRPPRRRPEVGEALVRYGSRSGRWVILAAVLGSGVAFLDSTVVNVALPAISRDLGGGLAGLQWTVDAYLLTLGSLIIFGGSLGDMYGRRRVFVMGLASFTLASVLCGLAPSIQLLIVARALQGVGGALLVPSSLAIISASFHPDDRGQAVGAWSGLSGVSTAFGPFIGGYLVDSVSWRWVFLINVPLAALTVWLTLRHVPETRDEQAPARPDFAGAAAAALA